MPVEVISSFPKSNYLRDKQPRPNVIVTCLLYCLFTSSYFIPLSRDDEYPAACCVILGGCDL
jgi:hypothetical protein